MQKMQKIGIIAISIFLIVLIVFVLLYDSVIDKTILKINGEKYMTDDFNNFTCLLELEQGTNIDSKSAYDEYINTKLYYQKALNSGITLTEDEIKELDEYYESESVNKEALSALGIEKDEYMNYLKEASLATKFTNSLGEYYPISDEAYALYKSENAELLKMYNYRIMQISHEIPEDAEDTTVTEEIKQVTKSKIESVLERVKSGEDFETVAEEYGTLRIVQGLSGFQLINNGQLESMPLVYLSDESIYLEIKGINQGEYTNIIETADGYEFAKLESIDENLTEEADAKLRSDLNTINAQQYITGTTEIIEYYAKVKNVKHVDFDKLPLNEVENTENETEIENEVVEENNAAGTEASEGETTAE